jgi:hypothetical protein
MYSIGVQRIASFNSLKTFEVLPGFSSPSSITTTELGNFCFNLSSSSGLLFLPNMIMIIFLSVFFNINRLVSRRSYIVM